MTILVTGASGFLGGRLTEVLAAQGERVRILVRSKDAAPDFGGLQVEVAEGKLEDASSLEQAVAGVRRVVHCAALSSDWGRWSSFYEANVAGVRRLLEAAARSGTVEHFLQISTTDVYGFPKVPCGEDVRPVRTCVPYSRSKGMGERLVLRFGKRHGMRVAVLRPASIYGPRCKPWVLETGRLLVGGNMLTINRGTSGAGLIYVDDVVDAVQGVWRAPATDGRCYNLCGPEKRCWRDYVDALADGLGVKRVWYNLSESHGVAVGAVSEWLWGAFRVQARPLITRHAVYLLGRDQNFPIDRARADFGFEPKIGLAEGMRRTVEWLQTPEGRLAVPR